MNLTTQLKKNLKEEYLPDEIDNTPENVTIYSVKEDPSPIQLPDFEGNFIKFTDIELKRDQLISNDGRHKEEPIVTGYMEVRTAPAHAIADEGVSEWFEYNVKDNQWTQNNGDLLFYPEDGYDYDDFSSSIYDDSDKFIEYIKKEIGNTSLTEANAKDTKLADYPLDTALALGDSIAEELNLPKSGKEMRDKYVTSVYHSLAREVVWNGTMSYRYISSALHGDLRPFFANEINIEIYAPMEWRSRITKQLISDFKDIFPEREDDVRIWGPYKESQD